MKIKIIDKISYQLKPITQDMVELDISMEDLKQIGTTKCFNVQTGELQDYVNKNILINELKQWFAEVYTYKEQKFRRLKELNIPDDDGADAHTKLILLYSEAETKRRKLQELEK